MEKPVYHIVVQGIHQAAAFQGDLNKEMYWKRIIRYKNELGLQLYAFAIFDNHAHFVFRGSSTDITGLMRRTGVSYSHWYRRYYNHEGSLFRGRPAMEMLPSDNEILKVARYIHQEPVKLGLVEKMENYVWSSYWMYQTNSKELDRDEITERLRFWGRFEDYMAIRETGTFLEEKEAHFGLTDEEVVELVERRLNGREMGSLLSMPMAVRNYLLAQMRFEDHISILQLARVTGVGRGIVQRITREDLILRLYRGSEIMYLKGETLPDRVMNDYYHWNVLTETKRILTPGDVLLPQPALQKAWAAVPGADTEKEVRLGEQAEKIYQTEAGFDYRPEAMVYVERTLPDGQVRKGLVARLDLEAFSLAPDDHAAVRLLSAVRLPEVMKLLKSREKRSIELPQIVLGLDDRSGGFFPPLQRARKDFQPLYGFELLNGEGSLKGSLVDKDSQEKTMEQLSLMMDPTFFAARYHSTAPAFLCTVLNGENMLAAASMHYEQMKVRLGPEEALSSLARFILVEIVDLNDPTVGILNRCPILRETDDEAFLSELMEEYPEAHFGHGSANEAHITMEYEGKITEVWIPCRKRRRIDVPHPMEFIQPVLKRLGARITYADSREEAIRQGEEKGCLALTWRPWTVTEIYDRVLKGTVFPAETFRLAHPRACFETRLIK